MHIQCQILVLDARKSFRSQGGGGGGVGQPVAASPQCRVYVALHSAHSRTLAAPFVSAHGQPR